MKGCLDRDRDKERWRDRDLERWRERDSERFVRLVIFLERRVNSTAAAMSPFLD